MANLVTFSRALLAIVVILIARGNATSNFVAIILTCILMLLDGLDGAIARYLNNANLQGSVWDILADRIIENIFFIYFASMSFFSIWIAIILMIRGLTVDAIRAIYLAQGKTAFGKTTLHNKKWSIFLTCSNTSRGLYNTLKMLTFISFIALLEPDSSLFYFIDFSVMNIFATSCLWLTFFLSLIRAFPVLFEGWVGSNLLKSKW